MFPGDHRVDGVSGRSFDGGNGRALTGALPRDLPGLDLLPFDPQNTEVPVCRGSSSGTGRVYVDDSIQKTVSSDSKPFP